MICIFFEDRLIEVILESHVAPVSTSPSVSNVYPVSSSVYHGQTLGRIGPGELVMWDSPNATISLTKHYWSQNRSILYIRNILLGWSILSLYLFLSNMKRTRLRLCVVCAPRLPRSSLAAWRPSSPGAVVVVVRVVNTKV